MAKDRYFMIVGQVGTFEIAYAFFIPTEKSFTKEENVQVC